MIAGSVSALSHPYISFEPNCRDQASQLTTASPTTAYRVDNEPFLPEGGRAFTELTDRCPRKEIILRYLSIEQKV